MDWEVLIGSVLTPILLLVFGWYWKLKPPKEINHLYGYRTRRSMSNMDVWHFANTIGAKMFIKVGWVTLIFAGLLNALWPKWAVLITMLIVLLGLSIGIYWCEMILNKYFNKNGNRKSKS